MATWWEEGAQVYFCLTRLTCAHSGGKRPTFQATGFGISFKYEDAMLHGAYIEEQLWAMKQGLA